MRHVLFLLAAGIHCAGADRNAKRLRRIFGRISSPNITQKRVGKKEVSETHVALKIGGTEIGNRNVVETSKLSAEHVKNFLAHVNTYGKKFLTEKDKKNLELKNGEYAINTMTFTQRILALSSLARVFIRTRMQTDTERGSSDRSYADFLYAGGAIYTALDNMAMAPLRLAASFSDDLYTTFYKMHHAQHLAATFAWGLQTREIESVVKNMAPKTDQEYFVERDRVINENAESLEATDTPEQTPQQQRNALIALVRTKQNNLVTVTGLWKEFEKHVTELDEQVPGDTETNICCAEDDTTCCKVQDEGKDAKPNKRYTLDHGGEQCTDLQTWYQTMTDLDTAFDTLAYGKTADKVADQKQRQNLFLDALLHRCLNTPEIVNGRFTNTVGRWGSEAYIENEWSDMADYCKKTRGDAVPLPDPPSNDQATFKELLGEQSKFPQIIDVETPETLEARCYFCGWNAQTNAAQIQENLDETFPPNDFKKHTRAKTRFMARMQTKFAKKKTPSLEFQEKVRIETTQSFEQLYAKWLDPK